MHKTDHTDRAAGTKAAALWARFFLMMMVIAGVTVISCNQETAESSSNDVIHETLPADPQQPPDVGADRPEEGISGIAPHQHDPRHGGVVRSVDVYHVELVQEPLEIWLYDRRGHPLPMDDVEGQIVIYVNDARHPYPLEVVGNRLSPVESVSLPNRGRAFLELTIGKQSIDAAFELPLRADASVAPGSQQRGV